MLCHRLLMLDNYTSAMRLDKYGEKAIISLIMINFANDI